MKGRLIVFLVFLGISIHAQDIREPAVAGTFYPASPNQLHAKLESLIKTAKPILPTGDIIGIWAPHAGLEYSGAVAAHVYSAVKDIDREFDAVVILASSHSHAFVGASISPYDLCRTPQGDIPVDQKLITAIRDEYPAMIYSKTAHKDEHVVEMQMIFVQHILPATPIVPIVLGRFSDNDAKKLAKSIWRATKGLKVLLIASSDLSHYPAYDDAVRSDNIVMAAIEKMDYFRLNRLNDNPGLLKMENLNCAICSWPALNVVMRTAQLFSMDNVVLQPYQNSGDVSGDRSRVVGYGAALFCKSKADKIQTGDSEMDYIQFSAEEKNRLFEIARASIIYGLEDKKMPIPEIIQDNLRLKRGVFVTLTNKGALRGCIGTFEARYPIWQAVKEMAESAATKDYRFAYNPITVNELSKIDIKISILSERRQIDDIEEIEVGKHGVWVEMDGRGGTYLPEVAVEQGWNRIEMLEHLCGEKAGLSPDAYKTGARIYIYTSQILSEEE
ncbi:AmmeMemoRadiSam system protein B [bacterium]|nr:AmmeMemoRadiSam system protein B [bacterium]